MTPLPKQALVGSPLQNLLLARSSLRSTRLKEVLSRKRGLELEQTKKDLHGRILYFYRLN